MMNHFGRGVMIVIVFVSLLLGICSCGLEESYKEFTIANITDCDVNDYISSANLEFARISDITIIPEIKEIKHGEYLIYLSAYSEIETNCIIVKNLTMSVRDKVFLEHELNQKIVLEQSENNIYEGWIVGGSFTDNEVDILNGEELRLIVQLQVERDMKDISKTIDYEIKVKIYKTWGVQI